MGDGVLTLRDTAEAPTAASPAGEATLRWLESMWAQPAQEFPAECEGASIACRGWNLDAADRRGIVLVHGFRAHARWWDHVAPALTDRHRVVAFDLSGMGDSDRRTTYSRVLHGREILAVADAAGIERPIVIAHSYGAIAALTAAHAHPDRMRRLIVVDAALPTEEEARTRKPPAPTQLRTYPDRETALSRFRLTPPGGWPDPHVLAYIARHSVRPLDDGRWGWAFDHDAMTSLAREDYRPLLQGPRAGGHRLWRPQRDRHTRTAGAVARDAARLRRADRAACRASSCHDRAAAGAGRGAARAARPRSRLRPPYRSGITHADAAIEADMRAVEIGIAAHFEREAGIFLGVSQPLGERHRGRQRRLHRVAARSAISGVSKMPGMIVFTRIPSRDRSRAIGSVMPTTPPLEAA